MASTQDMIAFSERMLAGMGQPESQKGESAPPQPVRTDETFMKPGEGLQNVEVPDNYLNAILGFSKVLEASETPSEKEVKAVAEPVAKPVVEDLTEAQRLEERITSLVERLTVLLREAKEVIREMTSTGSIGTGVQKSLGMKRPVEYPPKLRKKKKA